MLSTLSNMFGILGGIVTIFVIFRSAFFWYQNRYTWGKILRGIKIIENKVVKDSFVFDAVIGIRRSGAVCGAILAGNLGNIDFYAINVDMSSDSKSSHQELCARIRDDQRIQAISGKRILVVSCFNVTGLCPKAALDFLQSLNPTEMKFATLLRNCK